MLDLVRHLSDDPVLDEAGQNVDGIIPSGASRGHVVEVRWVVFVDHLPVRLAEMAAVILQLARVQLVFYESRFQFFVHHLVLCQEQAAIRSHFLSRKLVLDLPHVHFLVYVLSLILSILCFAYNLMVLAFEVF